MTAPRFLVSTEALAAPTVVLTGTELHHLRVRRLRPGSAVVLCDGHGRECRGVVTVVQRAQAVIRLLTAPTVPAAALRLTLAQAVLKGERLDLVIEKATELGASELLLFTCERTVRRVGAERQERWQRIAAAAAKQCQRSTLPVIAGPLPLDAVLSRGHEPLRLFFWENAGAESLQALHRRQARADAVLAVVGPEGGFSAAEAERAKQAGFYRVGLGNRILRAETAALAALALCQYLWGDLAGAGTD